MNSSFSMAFSAGAAASTRFRCVYQMPGQGLVRVPLKKDGLCGFLYYPDQGGPFPGVIILGGSNGGLYEWLARAFASNGFAALTLAYFQYPNLPPELVEIPLEYFMRAAAWMNLYDKPKVPRMIKLKWTKKSSKFPMKIVDWNRRENPVGYPAGRRHAPNEPD